MAKDKAVASGFWQGLFHFGLYKRNQGRVTRQVTFAFFAAIFLLAAYKLRLTMQGSESWFRMGGPAIVLALGVWAGFRMVNLPRFADFLIAVEAEMNKVSWPSKTELIRSSMVVIFVIFALAGVLFLYDIVWQSLFTWMKIRPG